MKKLMAMMLMLLAICANAYAIRFCGQDLDVRADIVQSVIERELPAFASNIGAIKHKFQINKNLPNLPEKEDGLTMCCDVEVEFTFKATTSLNGYALLRSMLCSKYGRYMEAHPIKELGKRSLMWTTESGQILLYTLGEKVYIHFFVARSIQLTFGSAI